LYLSSAMVFLLLLIDAELYPYNVAAGYRSLCIGLRTA